MVLKFLPHMVSLEVILIFSSARTPDYTVPIITALANDFMLAITMILE
jgi:hypothetical protein